MSTEYLGKATGLGVGAGTTHDEARRRTERFQLGNCALRAPVGSLPVRRHFPAAHAGAQPPISEYRRYNQAAGINQLSHARE